MTVPALFRRSQPIPQEAERPGAPPDLAVGEIIERLRTGWAWPEHGTISAVSWWESRTARLVRCRADEGHFDVVLKVGKGWKPGVAQMRYERMERLAAILAGREGAAQVPEMWGWMDGPPVIAMGYVPGGDLPGRLVEEPPSVWADWGETCGRTLGFIHRAELAQSGDGPARRQARAELGRAASRVLVPRRSLDRRARLIMAVRPYSDFMPTNFRASTGGTLYLVDAPAEEDYSSIHRDLAWFRAEMGPDFDPYRGNLDRAGLKQLKTVLWGAFLDGYASVGPADPRHPDHLWLVSLFRAYRSALQARHLAKTGRVGQAARQAGRAIGARLKL